MFATIGPLTQLTSNVLSLYSRFLKETMNLQMYHTTKFTHAYVLHIFFTSGNIEIGDTTRSIFSLYKMNFICIKNEKG